ncbi:hypothetical protein ACK3SF_00550 [Candidatus Nanosalina sp. VS9-1]|uniref:hypothetical protein n=1 Tax=Candidatus Nanosalina sp. VS9-1 TaxID=3388566 RepID=UPI0039E1408D
MTLSDRAVVFLVATLLSAATLSTAGIAEQNSVFQNKIFELRGQQLANDIDAMMYTDEGYLEKRLASETDLTITSGDSGMKIVLEREGLDDVEAPLDSSPSSTTLEDVSYLCIHKHRFNPVQGVAELVDVEGGQC